MMFGLEMASRRLAATALLALAGALVPVATAAGTQSRSTNVIPFNPISVRAASTTAIPVSPIPGSNSVTNIVSANPTSTNPNPNTNPTSANVIVANSTSPSKASTSQGPGGAAITWGDNYHGQLGQIFKDEYELSPVPVEGVNGITEIAAGASFDLALLGDGAVVSWGGNLYGELGDDTRLANWEEGYGHVAVREWVRGAKEPSEFPPLTGVKQIAAGGVHGLALMQNGTVTAWGNNEYGQLGDGKQGFESLTNTNQRVAKTVEWPAVNKVEKVLIKGVEKERTVKIATGKLADILAVAASGDSDYALTSEHTVLAWGSDTEGQLGLDLSEPGPEGCETEVAHFPRSEPCSTVPRLVEWTNPKTGRREPLKEVETVVAGRFSAYALLADGHVVSWGGNREGQLGTGAVTQPPHASEYPPAEVRLNDGKEGVSGEPLSGVLELAAGYDSVLARIEKGGREEIFGWGSDGEGALALEPGTAPVANCRNELSPKQEEAKLRQIYEEEQAISRLEEAIASQEAAGKNAEALQDQLAQDEKKLKSLPEPIACVKKAVPIPRLEALHPQALAAGTDYGLALSGGRVYAWGRNEYGELGNGKPPENTENPVTGKNVKEAGYPEPAQVRGFSHATAVAAGNTSALVLVESSAERPESPLTVTPEQLALGLTWSQKAAGGAEVAGQKLNYRVADRKGEPPAAEEGGDPAEESGSPTNNPEEAPTIFGLEEGEPPVVESRHDKLKVLHGGWTGARPIAFEYQWERCNVEGADCVKINREGHECGSSGCASVYSGHTLVKEDVGHTLRATVIAGGPEGQGTATTEPTEPVALEEGEAERTTEVGKSELIDPFQITRTLERFPLSEEQKSKGERKHREVAHKLEAVPYELKLMTREALAGQLRRGQTRTMIATPLPAQ